MISEKVANYLKNQTIERFSLEGAIVKKMIRGQNYVELHVDSHTADIKIKYKEGHLAKAIYENFVSEEAKQLCGYEEFRTEFKLYIENVDLSEEFGEDIQKILSNISNGKIKFPPAEEKVEEKITAEEVEDFPFDKKDNGKGKDASSGADPFEPAEEKITAEEVTEKDSKKGRKTKDKKVREDGKGKDASSGAGGTGE